MSKSLVFKECKNHFRYLKLIRKIAFFETFIMNFKKMEVSLEHTLITLMLITQNPGEIATRSFIMFLISSSAAGFVKNEDTGSGKMIREGKMERCSRQFYMQLLERDY